MSKFHIASHEREFRNQTNEALETQNRVLDVGRGAERGEDQMDAYGVDFDPEPERDSVLTMDVMREAHPHVVSDLSELPFDDGTFGVVFLESVLEHVAPIGKIDDCIDEVFRVLHAGGVAAGFVPFCWHFHGRSFPDPVRLTYGGLRRLLEPFSESMIEAIGGPLSVFLDSLPRGGYRIRSVVSPHETRLRYSLYEWITSRLDVSLRTPEDIPDDEPVHPYAINSLAFRFLAKK